MRKGEDVAKLRGCHQLLRASTEQCVCTADEANRTFHQKKFWRTKLEGGFTHIYWAGTEIRFVCAHTHMHTVIL